MSGRHGNNFISFFLFFSRTFVDNKFKKRSILSTDDMRHQMSGDLNKTFFVIIRRGSLSLRRIFSSRLDRDQLSFLAHYALRIDRWPQQVVARLRAYLTFNIEYRWVKTPTRLFLEVFNGYSIYWWSEINL